MSGESGESGESEDPSALPLAGQCGFNPDAGRTSRIFGGEDTKVGHYVIICSYVTMSLMSARRVPVYRAARDYEKANIQSAVC